MCIKTCIIVVFFIKMTHVFAYNYYYGNNNYGNNNYGNYYRDYGNYGRMRLRTGKYLPAPLIKSFITIEPAGFVLEWDRVYSYDDTDPVIGYKVKVWELCDMKQKYERADGVFMLADRYTNYQQPYDSRGPQETEPVVIILPNPEMTKTRVTNLKMNVVYEIRVLAFTRSMDGPPSSSTTIKLHKDYQNDRHKEVYIAS